MIINHNLVSMNIYNKLKTNTNNKSSIMQKLSSGFKINKAADNAAGLAISEKMKSQIRGLDQAGRNIQDGTSLIQVAEGGLNEITNQLQRMRELSVQASNGTLNDEDRGLIEKEMNQLKDGVNEIANNTEFNGKKLLNGSIGNSVITETVSEMVPVIETIPVTETVPDTITFSAAQILKYQFNSNPLDGEGLVFMNTIKNTKVQVNFTSAANKPGYTNVAIGSNLDDTLNNFVNVFNSIKNDPTDADYNKFQGIDIILYKNNIMLTSDNNKIIGSFGVAGSSIAKYSGNPATVSFDTTKTITTTKTVTTMKAVDTIKTTPVNNSIYLQIGDKSGDNFEINISDMSLNALNLNNINISNQTGAQDSISTIDHAISKVSSERSKCGAYQNCLEHCYNNITNTSNNLTSANSKITDTDMAKEIMELSKSNILENVMITLLSQSNQDPNRILSLLK